MTIQPNPLSADWFNRASTLVAPDLLGCVLARTINGETLRSQIVETEAYEAGDPAMAAYQRPTERNKVVFGPAGIIYIYRIYRQYHCFNIVCDKDNFASTILIRAVDFTTPEFGQPPSWLSPPSDGKLARLGAGPGKLCIALQLNESFKGKPIQPETGIWIEPPASGFTANAAAVTQTTRIGLTKGQDLPWRWYLTNSPAVSK